YDPTDALKVPRLLAEAKQEIYKKEKNEDFITLMSGIMGQKKRIHIQVGEILNQELDVIDAEHDNLNKKVQALAQVIDDSILSSYKLWPTNYIAYDLLHKTNKYADKYTESEKSIFERRLEMRIDEDNPVAVQGFLAMYANPVINKMKYADAV
ncbi:MAG: 1-acyl-sn-glycerol-3-phosphate acyltransferase, partial [Flavobacterium sp.]